MAATTILLFVFGIATLTNAVEMLSGGKRYFEKELDFIAEIEGTVNGRRFRVEGKGSGNGRTGFHKGKFVSLEGELPFSWSVASSTGALE